jgi:hypothetical protein
MKLAIDIDGCLAQFDRPYAKLLNWQFPEFTDRYPTVWDWDKAAGCPQENIDRAWQYICASNHFWLDLDPYPTTRDDLVALGQAVSQGHDVYFLTSRPGIIAKLQSEIWLRVHGYHYAPTVLIAGGPMTKGLICDGLQIEAAIDDRPENLIAIGSNKDLGGNNCRLFLFDRPWNRSALEPQTRVHSVIDMLDALEISYAVA